jgi:hypothetical protein
VRVRRFTRDRVMKLIARLYLPREGLRLVVIRLSRWPFSTLKRSKAAQSYIICPIFLTRMGALILSLLENADR